MLLRFIIVSIASNVVLSQKPSPCPEIFSYEPRGTVKNRWFGVISLSTPEEISGVWLRVILDKPVELFGLSGVWLRVILDRPTELLENWIGEELSDDNTEYTIKNPKYKLEAGPPLSIRFFAKYNDASIVPSVKTITFNGKTVCPSSSDKAGTTAATLHLGKPRPTRRPSSQLSQPSTGSRTPSRPSVTGTREQDNFGTISEPNKNNQRPNSATSNTGTSDLTLGGVQQGGTTDFFPGDFSFHSAAGNHPASRPTLNMDTRCGTVAVGPSPLLSFAQSTYPGQWPWHVAIYHSQVLQLVYTCGGTLITENYVLTAAHCVTKPQTNRPINTDHLIVYLGKHSLNKFGSAVQDREVAKIHVNPSYNYSLYFNDIAVLKLDRPADITNNVRTCCLWDENIDLENVVDKSGTVIGWGFDENRKISKNLMQAQMPVVSTIECIYSNREFFSQFTFEKTFCAGFRNGTSVCNGDSGGGMVFPKSNTSGQNTVWQIRGLVSVGVPLQGQGVCDPTHYVVFTDVAKHLDWIQQVIRR